MRPIRTQSAECLTYKMLDRRCWSWACWPSAWTFACQKGISVQLIDAADQLDSQPRATHYGRPAVLELARAGVLENVRSEEFISRGVCWRALQGEEIAGLDGGVLEGTPDQLTCLPLDRLGLILYKHLKAQPAAEVC